MARLVVLEYRPQYLAGLLALLVGAVFEALVFLGPLQGWRASTGSRDLRPDRPGGARFRCVGICIRA